MDGECRISRKCVPKSSRTLTRRRRAQAEPPPADEVETPSVDTAIINTGVDAFFQSSVLISSDEEDTVLVNNSVQVLNDSGSSRMPDLNTTDTNQRIPERTILIDDSFTSPDSNARAIQSYNRETEVLLGSVENVFCDKGKKRSSSDEVCEVPEKKSTGPVCAICLDFLLNKQAVSTMCGHLFCKDCIDRIIKSQKKCPTCRKALNRKKYHPIYF